jgi:hypothetical protein
MSMQDHIVALHARHAGLEAAVRLEIARPLPDEQRLSELKRQKLRLKDMITALARHAGSESDVPAGVLQQLSAEHGVPPRI